MIVIVLVLLIGGIGYWLWWSARRDRSEHERLTTLLHTKYQADVHHIGIGGNFIGFRFADDTVIYGTRKWDKILPASVVKAVEVRKDGATLTRTNRGSQLAGAALGGLALGGVGAIIGGLSGSSTSTERLKKLSLAFLIGDREKAVHEVPFGIWPGKGIASTSFLATQAVIDMDRIRAHALALSGARSADLEGPDGETPAGEEYLE